MRFPTATIVLMFTYGVGLFGSEEQEWQDSPGSKILDATSMPEYLDKYNDTGLFVEFFLPWCGHSRRLRSEFRRAAAVMGGSPMFARVDCSTADGANICQQNEITYHPTLLFFQKGQAYEYLHRATADEMVKYCRRMMDDDVNSVWKIVHLVDMLEREQVVVAAFVQDANDIGEHFLVTARNLKDQLSFVYITNVGIHNILGISTLPSYIILRQQQDSVTWQQEQSSDAESLVMKFGLWVSEWAVPLIEPLTQDNYYSKLGSGIPALILYRDDSARSDKLQVALYKTAAHFKGSLNVATLDGIRYQQLALKMGIPPRTIPSLVFVDIKNESHYVFPRNQPLREDLIFDFVQRVFAHQVSPTLRSADAPLHEDGPVYTLVAKEFRGRVMDPAKDVLVNFRTRWCGFCNLLEPTYRSLAVSMAHVDSLVLYEFDVSSNDPEPYLNLTSYPTITLFSAHNKTALTYMGDRSVSGLTEFLQKHVSIKIESLPDGHLVSGEHAERVRSAIDLMKNSITPILHKPSSS
ncbi:hypothetical protein GUITHDRAFT_106478 [Guillardia theta CCMP2712]|uniref:protein disulfide-isomerase n=2 Tax=Guillardia theta TaxID=55529 RepID=L1JIK8_GUITC|nr:hypothetical protein GUITHDRAFT_106478 [Guillardia theta CCMP2712]EKX47930.1 hypothetical protein GUITHDRAFT_106478 [Guillardia theta CCMP2712]|eukprot:XP_005834910.1 hypothetical protein GUITHDRAFT_106478 [Guillardia theta CCMP2712]